MAVQIIADDPTKALELTTMIDQYHVVLPQPLCSSPRLTADDAVLVDYDLRDLKGLSQLRLFLGNAGYRCKRVFVLEEKTRWFVAQAYALGATSYAFKPLQRDILLTKLSQKIIEPAEDLNESSIEGHELAESALAFRSLFGAIASGEKVEYATASYATSLIIKRVTEAGLLCWIEEVRRHHEGTFQHCLLVSGVAVAFALSLKLPSADVHRLGLAATLHDIGKAVVPTSILDKPGRLTPEEEEVIRRHPAAGHSSLLNTPGLEPTVLDAVLHHHEFLDGTGYPDRLQGSQIKDLTRLLTISDIFGALVEDRSYRPAMEPTKAYGILRSMEGKLEGALVDVFGKVSSSLDY